MSNCNECGKKLRFWEGYKHPILGKKYFVCRDCFERLYKSLEFYNECLFIGRQNHKKECYFWDSENKKCKNEKYFKNMNGTKNNSKNLS